MVTIGMNYKMIPGKEKIFEDAFSKVIDVMNEMEGHSKSSLYKDVSDLQSYLIVSEWNSEDAYNDFIQSASFLPFYPLIFQFFPSCYDTIINRNIQNSTNQ